MNANARIKEYIETHGIKQSFLVQKTGFRREKIANIINGKRKVTADELAEIAKALNVDILYFFN